MAGTNPNQTNNPMGQTNDPNPVNPIQDQSTDNIMANSTDPNSQLAEPVMPPNLDSTAPTQPTDPGVMQNPSPANAGVSTDYIQSAGLGNQAVDQSQQMSDSTMQTAGTDNSMGMNNTTASTIGTDTQTEDANLGMNSSTPAGLNISDEPVKATIEDDETTDSNAVMTPGLDSVNTNLGTGVTTDNTETATLTSQSVVSTGDQSNNMQPTVADTTPTDLDLQMKQAATNITNSSDAGSQENVVDNSVPQDPMANQNVDNTLGMKTEAAAPNMGEVPVTPTTDLTGNSTQVPVANQPDPMAGVIETPGPDFDNMGSTANQESVQSMQPQATEMTMNEPVSTSQATDSMGSTIPSSLDQSSAVMNQPVTSTVDMGGEQTMNQTPMPNMNQSSSNLDVVAGIGGLPPLDTPDANMSGQSQGGSRKGMIILIVGILIIGIILFLVGVLLASGGSLPF